MCARCLNTPEALTADYYCSSCRTPFLTSHPLDEEGRCGLCRRGFNGFDAAYTFGSYEGALRELIHLFKYGGIVTLAEPLGKMMASVLPRDERFDFIVPMPLYWWRRWRRGYNQSRLLANILSKRTGLPVLEAAQRRRGTAPQAGLSNSGRRRNVAGAFSARKTLALGGRRILLVDDVFTTGATASACAAALKRGGATHVSVLALARTDRRIYTEPRPAAEPAQSAAVGAS